MIAAVHRLRDDPAFYSILVENGARAVRDYTVEAMRDRWVQVIDDPIRERYHCWLEQPRWKWLRTAAIAEMDMHYTKIRGYARRALVAKKKH